VLGSLRVMVVCWLLVLVLIPDLCVGCVLLAGTWRLLVPVVQLVPAIRSVVWLLVWVLLFPDMLVWLLICATL
jgi:hypothetical protein